MPAAEANRLSLRRRGAALASMLGASAVLGWESFRHIHPDWLGVTFAAMLAIGGIGITARNLVVQTLSRGMAAILAIPCAAVLVIAAGFGHFAGFLPLALAATAGAALAISRPGLSTREAREQFNPLRFRRTLLAGSTATAATAYLTGGIALDSIASNGLISATTLGFGALTVALLAVATAVVRMRAWGILLGAATSATLIATGALMGNDAGFWLAMLAAPTLLLHSLPILWARCGAFDPETPARSPLRVASAEPARYRIALDDELDAAIEADREELPQERRHVHV